MNTNFNRIKNSFLPGSKLVAIIVFCMAVPGYATDMDTLWENLHKVYRTDGVFKNFPSTVIADGSGATLSGSGLSDLLEMAIAFNQEGNKYYQDPAMKGAIIKELERYYRNQNTYTGFSRQWWEAPIAMLMMTNPAALYPSWYTLMIKMLSLKLSERSGR